MTSDGRKRAYIYITVRQEIKHGLGRWFILAVLIAETDYNTFVMMEVLRLAVTLTPWK